MVEKATGCVLGHTLSLVAETSSVFTGLVDVTS